MHSRSFIHQPGFCMVLWVVLAIAMGGCATGHRPPPRGGSRTPTVSSPAGFSGIASWYGRKFHGRRTASGERFDMYAFTAAHRTFPFGTRIRVTNLENGKQVTVRINDRGPFVKGRIIDLSYIAAKRIGLIREGVTRVRLEILRKGS